MSAGLPEAAARPIRVLHCPTNNAGHPQQLARAEREIGLESVAVSFAPTPFGLQTDEVLFRSGDGPLRRELKRYGLVWRAIRDFDVVHYNFGSSILPHAGAGGLPDGWGRGPLGTLAAAYHRLRSMRDLALLRRAGKAIVVTYQGNDARQGAFCRSHFAFDAADEFGPGFYSEETDRQKREMIAKFARYAHRVYALNPDLLHLLPARAEFLPYASVDIRELSPRGTARPGAHERLTIVHAPSHRGTKGTRFVLEAVERLRAEAAADFELVLVENVDNAAARAIYTRADLVVDQLLNGWYGGLAVEAMALGRPVVCYIRDEDLGSVPAALARELPIIRADPPTIYEVLRDWLTVRRGELADAGARGRAFVERWHDPLDIATRLAQEYRRILAGPKARGPGAA